MSENLRSTYLGFSTHYKLHEMRKDLAAHVTMSWLAAYPPFSADEMERDEALHELHGLADCLGLDISRANRSDLQYRDYDAFLEIDRKVAKRLSLFAPSNEKIAPGLLESIDGDMVDSIVSVSEIAMHAALATGAESLVYHGEEADYIPGFINVEKGKRILGSRFTCVDPSVRDKSRLEIRELFPAASSIANDPEHPLAGEVSYMLLTLVDILVATRIGARLLLVDAHISFSTAERVLPASQLLNFFGLRGAYERKHGHIVMTPDQGILHGWNAREMMVSRQYSDYCLAHGFANRVDSSSAAIGRMASAVESLKSSYKGIEKSNIGFIAVKSIEKTLKCIAGDRWGNVRELADIVDKLLKERDDELTIYDGACLKTYCELLSDRRIFGNLKKSAKRSWRERLGINQGGFL